MSEQSLTRIDELIGTEPMAPPAPTAEPVVRVERPLHPEHAALVAERKAIQQKGGRPPKVQPTRDVLMAKGHAEMVRLFPKVVTRLESALDNPADPLHERAVDILAKRALNVGFFEALAKQEFRPDNEGGGGGQHITINVIGTSAPVLPADVVDVDSTEKQ